VDVLRIDIQHLRRLGPPRPVFNVRTSKVEAQGRIIRNGYDIPRGGWKPTARGHILDLGGRPVVTMSQEYPEEDKTKKEYSSGSAQAGADDNSYVVSVARGTEDGS
jgi:hypothetical protein